MKVKKVKFDEQVIKIMAAGGANSKDVEKLQEEYDYLYNAFPKTTGEGESITLETAQAPMNIDLKGNTSQDTTTGKQLIGVQDKTSTTTAGITFSAENGIIKMNGTTTAGSNYTISLEVQSLPTGNYCLYLERKTTARIDVSLRDENGVYVENANFGNVFQQLITTKTFTTTADTNVGRIVIYIPSGVTINDELKFMLVSGSTAPTEWEEYSGGSPAPNPNYPQDINVVSGDNTITIANSDDTESQSYSVNLGSLELCKIGTYQDYIYKTDKWYLHKEIGKVELQGTENWTYQSPQQRFVAPYSGDLILTALNLYCNYYNHGLDTATNNNCISFWTNGNARQVLIHDERFTTKGEFNAWLSSNKVIAYAPLYTPTNTEITDATLISQLEALKQAISYNEQTNISSTYEEGNAPFIINASALYDLNNLIPTNTRTLSVSLNKINNKNIDLNAVEEVEETEEKEEKKENIEEEATEK